MADYNGDDLTDALGLLKATREFMRSQRITCEETIYQSDRVIENAYDFIAELCDIVGYPEEDEG